MSTNFEQVLTESEIELHQKVQQVFESFKSPYGNETAVELTRIYFDTLTKLEQDYEDEDDIDDAEIDAELLNDDMNA